MTFRGIYLAHVQEEPTTSLDIVIQNKEVPLPKGMSRDDVQEAWKRECAANDALPEKKKRRKLVDRNRYFLDTIANGAVSCSQGKFSDYAHSHARLQEELQREMSDETMRDYLTSGLACLGVAIICKTADAKFVVQYRSAQVMYGQKTYMVPAGGFLPEDFQPGEHITPFITARKQLRREQNITVDDMRYLGISLDTAGGSPNPTFFFGTETSLDETAIKNQFQYATDNWETQDLSFPAIEDIPALLSGEQQPTLLPQALGGLILYANVSDMPYLDALSHAGRNPHIDGVRVLEY